MDLVLTKLEIAGNKIDVTEDLIDLLFKLDVIKVEGTGWDPWHGYNVWDYVGRVSGAIKRRRAHEHAHRHD